MPRPAAHRLRADEIGRHLAIVSLATIDFVSNPEGIDGRTGAQIENVGDFDDANDLAESLRIGALPIELKLISQSTVSATLGQQALDQGLVAGIAGFVVVGLYALYDLKARPSVIGGQPARNVGPGHPALPAQPAGGEA